MCRFKALVSAALSRQAGTAYLQHSTVLAATIIGLTITGLSRGDETKSATQPQASAPTPAAPPAQAGAAPGEDHVRHHGALGLLLSKAQDAVMIVGVIPNSPAARAGLKLGDEVLYVGDVRIHTIPELTQTVASFPPGANLELLIRRNGKRRVVEANLADRDSTSIKDQGSDPPSAAAPAGIRAQSPAPARVVAVSPREQQLNQRMRLLEKQIYQMQQSLNELRYAHTVRAAQAYEAHPVVSPPSSNGWYQQEQSGQADDDPDIFQ